MQSLLQFLNSAAKAARSPELAGAPDSQNTGLPSSWQVTGPGRLPPALEGQLIWARGRGVSPCDSPTAGIRGESTCVLGQRTGHSVRVRGGYSQVPSTAGSEAGALRSETGLLCSEAETTHCRNCPHTVPRCLVTQHSRRLFYRRGHRSTRRYVPPAPCLAQLCLLPPHFWLPKSPFFLPACPLLFSEKTPTAALFPVPSSTSLAGWGQPLLTQPASVLTGHYLWEEAQLEIWGE